MQALAAPANHQHHQQHEPRRNRLRARDLMRDFEQDGHEVYNSPQANLGAALAALGQLGDTPVVRRLQANLRVTTAQVEERGPGYIVDQPQVPTPGVDLNIHISGVAAMVPLSQ
jgi:hypothetical protein